MTEYFNPYIRRYVHGLGIQSIVAAELHMELVVGIAGSAIITLCSALVLQIHFAIVVEQLVLAT